MTETVLYVAASETDAHTGATALEEAGPLAVEPAVSLEKVESYASGVDCVVFAETPTTTDGAHLLEVVDACGETPLVLYSEGEYGPTAARSTDGIDGYVRRDREESIVHLADEVVWNCADTRGSTARVEDRSTIERLREMTSQIGTTHEDAEVLEVATETAATLLDSDDCAFLTFEDGEMRRKAGVTAETATARSAIADGVANEAMARGESILIGDVRGHGLVDTGPESSRSIVAVPVEDAGAFRLVADEPDAFGERDLEILEVLAAFVTQTLGRRRTERDAEAELEDARALFENVARPAIRYEAVDGEPIVREANAAFEEVFGYDSETIVGEDVDEYVVPTDLAEEADELTGAAVDGQTRQRLTRRRTEDGMRDFLVDVVPACGDECEGFAIYTDVTETKRRERELAARNERLDEFASIVSHDLRNPLNVAEGYLELATETGDLEHLEEVERAHARMRELLETLLGLARRGEVIDDTEPVAVCDIARRAWSGVETGDADLVLGEDTILEADKARLVEVFENLLRNSREHATTGDGLTIKVGATEDGFFFEDDGVGIPEGDRETVFESGYTTDPDGTGYGLDIVDRIAQAHGWTVEVGESDDGGARFTFSGVETDVLETDLDRTEPTADV